ncbi:MAG: hypothetical protein ACPGUD_00410 [Parashewanella sp.]
MKSLILLTALALPAWAGISVHHFDEWVGVGRDTSRAVVGFPLNKTNRQFELQCFTDGSKTCLMMYGTLQKCTTDLPRTVQFVWFDKKEVGNYNISMPFQCVHGVWTNSANVDEFVVNSAAGNFSKLSVQFTDDDQSVNFYSPDGIHQAMPYLLGNDNNFAQF